MTVVEVFEMTSKGGATDFAVVIEFCQSLKGYCLIGGLAVNCYVEPVYTMDADFVLVPAAPPELPAALGASGFKVDTFAHSIDAFRELSNLRIQFTTDPRYAEFPNRALEREVLGETVRVAALEDVFQGKLWAWSDPARRLTKRKKDELDLIRLAESYPALRLSLPDPIRVLFEAI